MERDAAQHLKRTTQFSLRVGDQVSYNSEPFILTHVSTTSANEPTKATIRQTGHSGSTTSVVKYADLRPIADPRPSHLLSLPQRTAITVTVGQFVFFRNDSSNEIKGGVVIEASGQKVVVHEYRQAPSQKRRFSPLYINRQSGSMETKVKPTSQHRPVNHDISNTQVLVSGGIHNFFVDANMFDTLQSMGVAKQA